jgi:ribosomal-protein-alanine N-acetyltransferase
MKNNFPALSTERLTLRTFELSDADEVQRMAGSQKIAETTTNIPHPYLDGMAEEWISKHQEWFEKNISVDFAIEIKESKKLIGNISLMLDSTKHKAEIGYWIDEEFWNKGFCTEALKAVIKYAFTARSINKITSRHLVTNPASGKVMVKSGLAQEGYLKQDVYKNGHYFDTLVYGLVKTDWMAMVLKSLR